MATFVLHPDLEAGTEPVLDLSLSAVRLSRDARYPWLILVPRLAHLREVFELQKQARATLMEEIAWVSEVLARLTEADKINVAALGNVTPQLHVHIVARFRTDEAWPGPIWGRLPAVDYEPEALRNRLSELRAALERGGPART